VCYFAGTFDILVYADDGADVPATWVDTQDRMVTQAAVVDMRNFKTGVHTVDATVFFRNVVQTS
jgi:mitotic spindle assembly checkpoint protein MAD2